MQLSGDWRYLWLDEIGVPHTLPILGVGSPGGRLPPLLLIKGEAIPPNGSPTAALVAPDGHCWAWNRNDDGEWSSVEQAVAALRKRMGKSTTPKLVPEQEPEPAE